MRRSRFLSLSGARPLSEPLPIGGRQLPDSSAFCPSMCNSIHILTCRHKSTNRPHYAARILKNGNGVADSLPLGSGNLDVQLGRQRLPLAHPRRTVVLSQRVVEGSFLATRVIASFVECVYSDRSH